MLQQLASDELNTGLPAKNGEKAGKYGCQKLATGGLCRGSGSEAPSRRKQGGVGAEPPATENFCIFYLKKQFLAHLTV